VGWIEKKMFRSTVILVLTAIIIAGPLPAIGSLQVTLIGNQGVSAPDNGGASKPDPVTRMVERVRHAFYMTCVQAIAARDGQPSPIDIAPEKEIIISIDNQEMYLFEDGRIVRTNKVSTGIAGHRTPPGDYMVRNKSTKAWSNKYECMMLHWMSISRDGQYGIHALQGRSYLRKLGRPASHGCIRLSHDDATDTYGWADVGTPVTIVTGFDPEPYKYQNKPVSNPDLPSGIF
jgi:lipoprotein-anchoring transpeptidase ErfK/SrfK